VIAEYNGTNAPTDTVLECGDRCDDEADATLACAGFAFGVDNSCQLLTAQGLGGDDANWQGVPSKQGTVYDIADVISDQAGLYVLVDVEKTWADARTFCQAHYYDLASVHTSEQYANITNLCQRSVFGGGCHVGMHDNTRRDTLMDLSGGTGGATGEVTYTVNVKYEPCDDRGALACPSDESCSCHGDCRGRWGSQHFPDDAYCTGPAPHRVPYSPTFFVNPGAAGSWADARAECVAANGDLVVIRDAAKNRAVRAFVRSLPPSAQNYSRIGTGYCSDWVYLPEGGYPPLLTTTSPLYSADRVRECMNRCQDAAGQNGQRAAGDPVIGNDNFYVRKSDFRCGCAAESSAACTLSSSSSAYHSLYDAYTVTEPVWLGAHSCAPRGCSWVDDTTQWHFTHAGFSPVGAHGGSLYMDVESQHWGVADESTLAVGICEANGQPDVVVQTDNTPWNNGNYCESMSAFEVVLCACARKCPPRTMLCERVLASLRQTHRLRC
jgi:hypothetical protein